MLKSKNLSVKTANCISLISSIMTWNKPTAKYKSDTKSAWSVFRNLMDTSVTILFFENVKT